MRLMNILQIASLHKSYLIEDLQLLTFHLRPVQQVFFYFTSLCGCGATLVA